MKKVFAIAMFLLSFGVFAPETAQAHTKSSTQLSNSGEKIKVTFKFGRKKKNCTGFGVGCFKIEVSIDFDIDLRSQNPVAEILVRDAKKLDFTFLTMGEGFNEDTNIFVIDEDAVLTQEVSSKLGFGERKVVMKAGEYVTTKNESGKVVASVNYQVL